MGIFRLQKVVFWLLLTSSALLFNPWISTDVFELPKSLALFVLVGILTVLQIYVIASDRRERSNLVMVIRDCFVANAPRNDIFFGLLALFAIGQIGAFLFSDDRAISAFGAPMRLQGFVTALYYLLLLFNTHLFFQNFPDEKTKKIFRVFPFLAAAVCLLALGPYVFPMTFPFYIFTPAFFDDRVFGTFGNPNYLAAFLIAVLPFIAFDQSLKKILKIALVALVLVTLFLTGTRSAWIAGIIIFLLFGIFDAVRHKQKTVLVTTAAIILLLAGGWMWKNFSPAPPPPLARISLDTQNSTSLQTRVLLWKAGFELFTTRPFFGYGQDNIRDAIEPHLPEYLRSNEVFFIDRTHSEFIDILAMNGIFAFIGYVGFFGLLLWQGFKFFPKDPALLSMAAILLFHAVNFSTTSSNILLYFLAGYLLSKLMSQEKQSPQPTAQPSQR